MGFFYSQFSIQGFKEEGRKSSHAEHGEIVVHRIELIDAKDAGMWGKLAVGLPDFP